MASHIFISHSSRDKETAKKMVEVLEARGLPCWIAERDIQPGTEYAASIVDAIEASRAMVFIISEDLNASHQVTREAERAVNKGLPVIPVRLEEVKLNKSLEYFLSSAHWFDAFPPPVDDHLERLAGSLTNLFESSAEKEEKPPTALGVPIPPAVTEKELTKSVAKTRTMTFVMVGGLAALVLIAGAIFFLKSKRPEVKTVPVATMTIAPPATATAVPSASIALNVVPVPSIAPAATPETVAAKPSVAPPPAESGVPREGDNFTVKSIGMPMVWVPPLGGWVGAHEVTQEEYAKAGSPVTSHYLGSKRPVDSVSYNDVVKFCESLNRMETSRLPAGFAYTLPTDEQWKMYAGDAGPGNAVFGRTATEGTADVGSKPPNVFGLYDVMGNVWEWTLDWHPGHVGKEKALRGGSFASRKGELMAADARFSGGPTNRYQLYGFRCILMKGQPPTIGK